MTLPAGESPPARVDGFVPIGSYAALSDGRTTALLAADGRVDWMPLPSLDSPPIFAAVLDPPRGGHLLLAPAGPFRLERHYIEGSNVVATTYATESGSARVTASLNTGASGRLPWTELAFRVDGLHGEVPFVWEVVPGDRFGRATSWISDKDGTAVIAVEDQALSFLVDGVPLGQVTPHSVGGRATIRAGRRALLALAGTSAEPLFVPPADEIDGRIDRTVESWQRWTGLIDTDVPWRSAVQRSALALKTLLAEHTGSIAAAATTSLPEQIGGTKNWDYRYAWVRDTSFVVDAFINLGMHEEVHKAVSWLLSAIRRGGRDIHVFYSLGGEVADEEQEIDAPGYRNSRPVRSGNSAADQRQLGTYGDLFDTICRYADEGHLIDVRTARLLADLATRCCDTWKRNDSGIWELDDLQHYTISKIGCWVALDRAVRLARAGQIPALSCDRWAAAAQEIHEWVDQHCWSEDKQSYTFYAGTEDLDAAVLLAGRTAFDRGARLASTIEAVVSELSSGAFVYRYSGMQKQEGAFVACSFWLVEALAHTGQLGRARAVMEEAVQMANDVGLLAEEIDPDTGEFLGNVPQGLSHLSLVNAAFTIARAGREDAG